MKPATSETWAMVMDYARKMEARLEDSRKRGQVNDFMEQTPVALLNLLQVASDAIGQAIDNRDSFDDIRELCADVGNIAMMIALVVEK